MTNGLRHDLINGSLSASGWLARGIRRWIDDAMRALACRLAQRSECGAYLLREELGFFPGGEVAALVDLVEVDGDVGVCPLDPAARGTPDFPGERGEADRIRDRRGGPARRT